MTTDQATPPKKTPEQAPDTGATRPDLTLWCADTEAAAPLAEALARAHAITRVDSLPDALPAGDAPVLMLYVSPARALAAGGSLLPAGVAACEGRFERGDAVTDALDLVAGSLDDQTEQEPEVFVVLSDQDACHE